MSENKITDLFAVRSKGLCSNLPPEVHDKYFVAGGDRRSFAGKTAKAICDKCPVREACLAAVVASSDPIKGITAGHTANEIKALRSGRKHEYKRRTDLPLVQHRKRGPEIELPELPDVSEAEAREIAIWRLEQLSFEERVYVVFQDIKAGKYAKLNDAVREIARIHEQGTYDCTVRRIA